MTTKKMSNVRMFFKGVKIDERTEDYIMKRMRTMEKILDKILLVEVEVGLDKKGKFRVEVMVKTPHKLYRAEETTESIEGSIDVVENELKIQIKKDKEKVRDLRQRGKRSIKKKTVVDANARF